MNDVYSEKPWQEKYDKNVAPTLTCEEKSFAEMFAETVAKYPDKTALIYMGRTLSFREVDDLSNRFANFLMASGLRPDDVVGLHMPNLPAHYIGVIGVQKAGCVSTGLSPLLTASEMEHQLIDSETKVVITVDILFEKIAEVAGKTPFTTVVVTDIADFLPGIKRVLGKLLKKIPTAEVKPIAGKNVKRFMEVIRESKADPVQVKRGFDDMIFMMYTGGTTGPAKGAMLTQRSYMSNRHQTLTWLDLQPEDVALSAFPLFHIAGLALGGFSMTNGITQICVPNPRDRSESVV
jgi:long-chain acyl-CoA synthetase